MSSMYGERFVFIKNIKQMSKNVVLKDNGDEMFKLQFLCSHEFMPMHTAVNDK